ncbi:type II secretion system F family protein [Candidatus Bathyarchaeota archaeon]|nr:type II secretion system F family protein [Candidatus Bathyarchaeota archaeon]
MLKLSRLVPQRLSSQLGVLQRNLARASIKVSFGVYLGLAMFTSLAAGATTLGISLLMLSISFPIIESTVFALLIGALVALGSVGGFYLYPLLAISSRKRKIDANLPLIANFMSVLASAGMPPERIFRSLANVGDEFGVGDEMRRAIGDIELMGLDLNGALRNASLRSASGKFGAMLDGVVTTSHMGGDLASFLREESDKFKKTRISALKSFVESLAGMAEVYVSVMIALPLALVVMLSIMSFLGGGASMIGDIDPQVLLLLMTFVITPASVAVMLLIVDSMTPPR